MLIQVAGEDQLVSLSLLQQYIKLGADLLRPANHRQSEEIADRLALMGQPQAVHAVYRWPLYQALAAPNG